MSADGGPAFPAPGVIGKVDEHGDAEPTYINWQGMTLRDYFAAAALPECLAYWRGLKEHVKNQLSYAELAYSAADEMLKERAK